MASVRPVVRGVHSPDVHDLGEWAPPPGPFAILVQLFVGTAADEGQDSFDVVVCNAEWVTERAMTDHVVSLRHHVVVDRFDWRAVRAYFEKRLSAIEGADWSELAGKLGRLGLWEFEDYRDSPTDQSQPDPTG